MVAVEREEVRTLRELAEREAAALRKKLEKDGYYSARTSASLGDLHRALRWLERHADAN